jgi:asparagine synthase (glutamine-hydrolysing)
LLVCGIAAFFSRERHGSAGALEHAVRLLDHRGPDSRSTWLDPTRRVGLGHARLSIIDLTTGDQPIASEDERLHLVVNGEFYDFERLQRELRTRGHRLRTRSDSEIALHLYEELGVHCLKHLRGEFALTLWDEPNQLLFAARDRFGIKPLFYALHDGTLFLASEVKALFAMGVPARWDRESLFHAAGYGGDPARTLYHGVHQLPPGHYLLAKAGQVRVVPYWDFNYAHEDTAPSARSEVERVEAFRSVFDEAVRLRLRADVPVGCYLSGGLDSCAVLGFAAAHHAGPIRAFTLSFDRPEYDEEAIAREMAARAGAEFVPIPITQDDLADHFTEATWHSETLCVNAHGVAKFILSRAVRDADYKVVLTGEGSDEILAGYPHFRRDMLMYNNQGQDPVQVQQLLRELERGNPVSRGLLLPSGRTTSLESVRQLLGFVPSWIETMGAQAYRLRELFSAEFLAEFEVTDSYRGLLNNLDYWGQLNGREPVHQSLYLWGKTFLPGYILTILGDRMEMGHSVEARLPFLDHHVVEQVCSLPVSLKIRGMTEKYLLREAARPVLTDTVYRREKHPFLSPPAAFEPEARLGTLLQDTLRGSAFASLACFDQRKVVALLDEMPAMDEGSRTVVDPTLMRLLSAAVLHERFALQL